MATNLTIREAVDPARHLGDAIAYHLNRSISPRCGEMTRQWHAETAILLKELKALRKRQGGVPVEGWVR